MTYNPPFDTPTKKQANANSFPSWCENNSKCFNSLWTDHNGTKAIVSVHALFKRSVIRKITKWNLYFDDEHFLLTDWKQFGWQQELLFSTLQSWLLFLQHVPMSPNWEVTKP